MAGVKGRSGRRGRNIALDPAHIKSLSLQEIGRILDEHRSGKNILTVDQVIKICQPIVLKEMADEHKITISHELNSDQMEALLTRMKNTISQRENADRVITIEDQSGS